MRSLSLVSLLILLLCIPLYSDTAQTQPRTSIVLSATELVRIAIDNVQKSLIMKRELISFDRTLIEFELDRVGNQKSVIDRTVTYHGKEYPKDKRTEDKPIVDFNKLLLQSYDYFIQEETPDSYVLAFRPKQNLPDVSAIASPEASALEKAINETAMRMNGFITIDKEHYFARKFSGKLSHNFTKYGVATVTMASIDLEQELRPDLDSIIVVKSVRLKYQIRNFLISYLTREKAYSYSNYRKNQ